jgi:hypothetical protein
VNIVTNKNVSVAFTAPKNSALMGSGQSALANYAADFLAFTEAEDFGRNRSRTLSRARQGHIAERSAAPPASRSARCRRARLFRSAAFGAGRSSSRSGQRGSGIFLSSRAARRCVDREESALLAAGGRGTGSPAITAMPAATFERRSPRPNRAATGG